MFLNYLFQVLLNPKYKEKKIISNKSIKLTNEKPRNKLNKPPRFEIKPNSSNLGD
jgi:hypothetical protein